MNTWQALAIPKETRKKSAMKIFGHGGQFVVAFRDTWLSSGLTRRGSDASILFDSDIHNIYSCLIKK
jgi:hypothetical protein